MDYSVDGSMLASASADKTVCVWDADSGRRIKKYSEHSSHVNSVCCARDDFHLLATASDDCTTRVRPTSRSFLMVVFLLTKRHHAD